MSWLEQVEKLMTIICGDGREYNPLWVRSTVEKDYNVTEFNFIEVSGTLVRRYNPKGARYSIKICFEGDNHLDDVGRFMDSADDPRPWIINHPLYGSIKGQPVRLQRDDTSANVTEITGIFVESITEENPQVSVAPSAQIIADKRDLDDIIADYYVSGLSPSGVIINPFVRPTVVVQRQRATLSQIYNSVSKKVKGATASVKDTLDADQYFNLFSQANTLMLNLTSEPLAAARAVIAVINAPFNFLTNVKARIGLLSQSFTVIRESITGLSDTANDALVRKRVYETNSVMTVSAMAITAILQYDQQNNQLTDTTPPQPNTTNQADYNSRQDVIDVIETLLDSYNTFMGDIDSIQSENGGEENSYIPDFDSINKLTDLVDFTVSNLMDIVLNAKQERSIELPEDMNVITITQRYYGLDPNDVNLNRVMDNNNIGINELLMVSKGRRIVYYV